MKGSSISNNHAVSVLFVSLALVSCASRSLAQPAATQPSYLWKQCDEDAVILNVDPERIRPLVPAEHALTLENGQARIVMVAQDCPTYWFDGEPVGETQEVHHWVSLDKPSDVRIVAGAEHTFPTFSWYQVFMGSNNAQVREYWIRSGTNAQPINGLYFRPFDDERGGGVSVSDHKSYEWLAQTKPPFARIVGLNHDLYGQTTDGAPYFHRVQCLMTVDGWANEGAVTVSGGSDPHDLVPEGTYAAAVHTFQPGWCRATLAESDK